MSTAIVPSAGSPKAPTPPPRAAAPRQDEYEGDVDGATVCIRACWRCTVACCSAVSCCCTSCTKWLGGLSIFYIELILRTVNLCNAGLLGFAAYTAYDDLYGWVYQIAVDECVKCTGPGTEFYLVPPCAGAFLNVARVFLATYTALFAVMLFLFETRTPQTTAWIRKNFGFLFTPMGRGLFIVFLGTVCFGVVGDVEVPASNNMLCVLNSQAYISNVTIGTVTMVNAAFNFVIICIHPAYSRDIGTPAPPKPFDVHDLTDAEIKEFISRNPDIAAHALSASTALVARATHEHRA